ncbi:MAG: long-chain fatty acid--CoA ligase [Vicinamibacteraceae bacterium]
MATLADLPARVAARGPRPAMIRRCGADGFRDWSTTEFLETIQQVAAALLATGLAVGDRLAIVSESRPEWVVTDLAAQSIGVVVVPVYPTLPAAQVRYILADAGARLVVVSDRVQAAKVQEIRHLLPALELVVVIDPGGPAAGDAHTGDLGLGASVVAFSALVTRGRDRLATDPSTGPAIEARRAAVDDESLATIIYTSGTTGEPKGVMLTHRNIVSNAEAVGPVFSLVPDDVALSFLPLSHSFERTVIYAYLMSGLTIVFAENLDTIARDLRNTAPTLMTVVPRVCEKLHARVLATVADGPAVNRWLFQTALGWALDRVRRTDAGSESMIPVGWRERLGDRLVFAKVRARLGGRLRLIVTGSAPLSRQTGEFFLAAGLPIYEGYGLTETSPALAANHPGHSRLGTVGPVIPGVELRIAEDGEILARGPNVMRGYWNRPDDTAAVLRDGWFHTGDIGELTAEGFLRLTDRKKDLLVTSGGKKVAPQPIEARLKQNPLVAEAVVVGDRRRFPAALIVPAFDVLAERLKTLGLPGGERAALVGRADVLGLYREIVDALNRDLAQFEQLKQIALLPAEFTIAGGELTPTLKVRRRVVETRWQDTIERLYA